LCKSVQACAKFLGRTLSVQPQCPPPQLSSLLSFAYSATRRYALAASFVVTSTSPEKWIHWRAPMQIVAIRPTIAILLAGCALGVFLSVHSSHVKAAAPDVPKFKVDPSWPKELPNNWIMGQVGGMAVDRHDNI